MQLPRHRRGLCWQVLLLVVVVQDLVRSFSALLNEGGLLVAARLPRALLPLGLWSLGQRRGWLYRKFFCEWSFCFRWLGWVCGLVCGFVCGFVCILAGFVVYSFCSEKF
jgi:hypothetical protein